MPEQKPAAQKQKWIGNYANEAAAMRRQNKLMAHGVCTGYRVYEDGSASLLHDPDFSDMRHDLNAAGPEDD